MERQPSVDTRESATPSPLRQRGMMTDNEVEHVKIVFKDGTFAEFDDIVMISLVEGVLKVGAEETSDGEMLTDVYLFPIDTIASTHHWVDTRMEVAGGTEGESEANGAPETGGRGISTIGPRSTR